MTELRAIEKTLLLIRLLNTPPARTVAQLMSRLGMKQSALYRHIKLLKEIGYPIKTDENHRKYIAFSLSSGNSVLEPQELDYINDALLKTVESDFLKTSILHKLNRNLSLIPLADALPQLHNSRMLRLITNALEEAWCIKIKNYHSVGSNTITDRHIEPLELTQENRYLIGWDLDKDRQSQFKLERIGSIVLLEKEPITPGRIATPTDIFGLTGDEWKQVRIKLKNIAHHLLSEEFPRARPYIRKMKGEYYFDGPVRNWKGVGRFVLGLPGELEVIAPEEFKEYLVQRLKRGVF